MYFDTSWYTYNGKGKVPEGHEYDARGEQGRYLADEKLVTAVNTALTVEQPLLVVGESGTGKTSLAWSVASELGLLPVLTFHTRSDHRARDVLFVVDHLRRFYDAHVGDERAKDFGNYVTLQALGEAIVSDRPRVLLIDEIDKAPRDFPNDLLDVVDKMEFTIPGLRAEPFRAQYRPIVIITSNNERQLPDPFLRRCVFHYIDPPGRTRLQEIVRERLGHLNVADALIRVATDRFLEFRYKKLRLDKPPSTGELLAWVRVLVRAGVPFEELKQLPLSEVPFVGTLIKNKSDLDRLAPSAGS
jgi:MoxR-like ATPase